MTTSMTARAWPLRLLQFPLTRAALLTVILFYLYLSGLALRQLMAQTPLQSLLVVLAMIAALLAAYAGFAHVVERRQPVELALPGMGRELALGFLLGAGLYCSTVLILTGLGHYRIEGFNGWQMLFPALWFGFSSGAFEELLFRGVLLRIAQESLGSWAAILMSALVFGLVHLANPEASVQGALFIAIEFGVMLGACYVLTGRLWLGMGVHMAWNYTQSAVFGGAGSGNAAPTGWIRARIEGPELLTGGQFGLEASVVTFGLCSLCAAVMLVLAVRRGRIVAPLWRRKP